VIMEMGTAYPGYNDQIPKSAAMVSEILRQNGYSTAWIGKNHNVPDWETNIAGPFDRWPILQGFDHFYGFVGAEANQWAPALYRGNHLVEMEIRRARKGITRSTMPWPMKPSSSSISRNRLRRTGPFSSTMRPARLTLPIMRPRSGWTNSREVQPGLGQVS